MRKFTLLTLFLGCSLLISVQLSAQKCSPKEIAECQKTCSPDMLKACQAKITVAENDKAEKIDAEASNGQVVLASQTSTREVNCNPAACAPSDCSPICKLICPIVCGDAAKAKVAKSECNQKKGAAKAQLASIQ